jgi:hypothetical protein
MFYSLGVDQRKCLILLSEMHKNSMNIAMGMGTTSQTAENIGAKVGRGFIPGIKAT